MKKNKLQNIAPALCSIWKQGACFEIPDGYFENFELDTKKLISSKELQKKTRFDIPQEYFSTVEDVVLARLRAETMTQKDESTVDDGYFNALEDRILEQVGKSRTANHFPVFIKRAIIPIAIAASVLLLFNIFGESDITFDQLDTTDIETWIAFEADLDTENLLAAFEDTDLDDNLLISTVSNEEMMEFLVDEQLDDDWLYEN